MQGTGEETGTTVTSTDDEFGYRWMILADPDFEDLVVGVNAVSTAIQGGGYGDRILCAVFAFRDSSGKPVYWIYNYKRGGFYPFVPARRRPAARQRARAAPEGPDRRRPAGRARARALVPPLGHPDLRPAHPTVATITEPRSRGVKRLVRRTQPPALDLGEPGGARPARQLGRRVDADASTCATRARRGRRPASASSARRPRRDRTCAARAAAGPRPSAASRCRCQPCDEPVAVHRLDAPACRPAAAPAGSRASTFMSSSSPR